MRSAHSRESLIPGLLRGHLQPNPTIDRLDLVRLGGPTQRSTNDFNLPNASSHCADT